MSDAVASIIRAFIVENFLFGQASQPLVNDTSLIENDVIDSTSILELVAFLEEKFGIAVMDAEIVPSNLDTIANLCSYVSRKTGAAAAVT
jgi:acyl carrier protein